MVTMRGEASMAMDEDKDQDQDKDKAALHLGRALPLLFPQYALPFIHGRHSALATRSSSIEGSSVDVRRSIANINININISIQYKTKSESESDTEIMVRMRRNCMLTPEKHHDPICPTVVIVMSMTWNPM